MFVGRWGGECFDLQKQLEFFSLSILNSLLRPAVLLDKEGWGLLPLVPVNTIPVSATGAAREPGHEDTEGRE